MLIGQVKPTNIVDEMKQSYVDYAMSVIVSRALPDVRDGLKPVHRRIIYAAHKIGLKKSSAYKKSATLVGEVLGKYHPHGDKAVYDAMVRLAQDFSMRYPLVDGQGNFGSIDGDSAAAMRYTETRLERITEDLLADIDCDTVNFIDNFDGSHQEPQVLPAKLPNLLLMGSEGIAVGMATKIPPHNLIEVCDTIKILIASGSANQTLIKLKPDSPIDDLIKADPQTLAGEFTSPIEINQLMETFQGPDFPTAGNIYNWQEITAAYLTGKGKITIRGVANITTSKKSGAKIIITELPYQVNKARLVQKIALLVKNKKIVGVKALRDESDREGLRIVIELKRDSKPKSVLNKLFKFTSLQTSFPVNMVALNADGIPQLMNLKNILTAYVKHRQIVITRRSQFKLKANRLRLHILEGLLKAIDIIDEVIETIKKSPTTEKAKTNLMTKFDFSEIQAQTILDMQLKRLAALERQKLEEEYKEIQKIIKKLVTLLTQPKKILNTIVKDLDQIKEKHGDPRRTKVFKRTLGEFSEKDLIAKEDAIITVTQTGYLKRLPLNTYRTQRRGGKGVSGMATKEDDSIAHILTASTHDDLLIFTNKGRCFRLPVYELPAGSRQSKGQAIINLINIEQNETIRSILTIPCSS